MILNEQLNVIPRDINIIINLFHRTGESDVYFIRKYNNRMTVDEISNIHDKMKKVQLRYGEYEVTKVTVEDSKTIKIMCIYPWKVVRMMDYAVYMSLYTGELFTPEEAVRIFREEYDGDDDTNCVEFEDVFEGVRN